MTYDEDIRWAWTGCFFLMIADVAGLAFSVYEQSWMNAMGAGLWLFNLKMCLTILKVQQRTRDESRVSKAAETAL